MPGLPRKELYGPRVTLTFLEEFVVVIVPFLVDDVQFQLVVPLDSAPINVTLGPSPFSWPKFFEVPAFGAYNWIVHWVAGAPLSDPFSMNVAPFAETTCPLQGMFGVVSVPFTEPVNVKDVWLGLAVAPATAGAIESPTRPAATKAIRRYARGGGGPTAVAVRTGLPLRRIGASS